MKVKKITYGFTALVFCLGSFASHAAPKATDIVGINLGDTIEAAKEKIEAHNAALKAIEVPARDGGVFGVVAQISNPPRDYMPPYALVREDFFISPTAAGTVGSMTRLLRLDETERFTEDKFHDALVSKYGEPTTVDKSRGTMNWAFDRDGNHARRKGFDSGQCGTTVFSEDVGKIYVEGEDYWSFGRRIRSYQPDCATIIFVNYHADQYGLVTEYDISIADVRAIYDELEAREAAEKAAAEAKQEAARAEALKAAENSGGPTL